LKRMDIILWLPRALYKIYAIIVFVATFLLLYPLYYITLSKKKWHKITIEIIRFHVFVMQLLGGIITVVKRAEKTPVRKPYVICPNHSSYLDIPLVFRVIKDYFIFLGKREIENYPLFHIFFTKGMNVLVDRSSKLGSHKAFMRACEEIDKGNCVLIFPEATIPDNAPVLNPFKNGAFKLAIEKQVPIIPITFTGNWKILQGSKMFKGKAGPGITKVIVHPSIDTRGMTENDITALKNRVFEVMNAPLLEKNSKL
jgi:1-acyl-sn-glycerol-3-phosphate acyltransferase